MNHYQDLCIVFVTEIPTKLPTKQTYKLNTLYSAGASGEGVINSHKFEKDNFEKEKTAITTNQEYEILMKHYKTKPYFNLFMFTIFDKTKLLGKEKNKLCCIILFKNNVYIYHYVCSIDTIEEKKQLFKNIIEKSNMDIKDCSLIKINFNEEGKFKESNDELFD
jgi:hypothetical protein